MHSEISGGITAPKGFLAAGVHCGIKLAKKDLALIYSNHPAVAAGVFTTNRVPAAPVLVDREQLNVSRVHRAVVVNSGNANACTGDQGLADAWAMVRETAGALGVRPEEVLVSSTGVIGQVLPMDKIRGGIRQAAGLLSRDCHLSAADAIRTTDTFAKELAVTCTMGGTRVTIGGMAKGSGMIAPNMATMLAFVTTDAAVPSALLREIVKGATDRSFNRITVDGDTSTNDMVLVLANGSAGNPVPAGLDDPASVEFASALEHLLTRLSKMIVMDGEGATKFVEIQVTGAASDEAAVRVARSIANSNLVKTAIHGEDANWGRIIAAAGNSGVEFDPSEVEIFFGSLPILRKNFFVDFPEEEAKKILGQKEINITVSLDGGSGSASFWTCDLSKQYVEINANYRT